jgi:signal transduction histidine kinase
MTGKFILILFLISFLDIVQVNEANAQSDTAVITEILDRATLSSSNQKPITLEILDSALLLLNQVESIDHYARFYNIKGSYFLDRNEFDTALYYYRKGLFQKNGKLNRKRVMVFNSNIGICLIKLNQFDSVPYFIKESLRLAKLENDSSLIASNYIELSHYFKRLSKLDSSYHYCEKAENLFSKIHDTTGLILTNNALSLLYVKMGFHHKAIKKLKYVIQLDSMYEGYYVLTTAYLNLSDIYSRKLSNYDSAVYYLQECVKESEKTNNIYMLEATKVNMSNVLFSQNKYAEIIQLLLPNRNSKYAVIQISSIINTGIAFTYLNNDSGRYFLQKGNNLAKENSFIEFQSIALDNLYRYDSLRGDFKNAFLNYQKYISVRDTLSSKENRVLLSNLEKKFELEEERHEKEYWQMEAKIKEEQFQNKVLGNQLLILLIIALILMVTILAFFRIKMKKLNSNLSNSNIRLQQSNEDLKEINEMKTTLMSILSHDLKSSIIPSNQLLHLLYEGYDDMTSDEIIKILKSATRSSDNVSTLLDNLLQWIQLQFDKTGHQFHLEKVDIKERVDKVLAMFTPISIINGINISSTIKESVDIYSQANIIDTILRNLLSNANKFTPPGGTIIIDGEIIDDLYKLTIRDTGIGIKKEVQEQLFNFDSRHSSLGIRKETGNGLGLKLIYQMVKASKGSITVKSEIGKGSQFIITLPLCKNDPSSNRVTTDKP